jgi:hypothetical protein
MEFESPTWRAVKAAHNRRDKAFKAAGLDRRVTEWHREGSAGRVPTHTEEQLALIAEIQTAHVAECVTRDSVKAAKTASPKPRRAPKKGSRKVKVTPNTQEPSQGFTIALDCFRASGKELRAMGTPEAAAEIARRKAKREGKVTA